MPIVYASDAKKRKTMNQDEPVDRKPTPTKAVWHQQIPPKEGGADGPFQRVDVGQEKQPPKAVLVETLMQLMKIDTQRRVAKGQAEVAAAAAAAAAAAVVAAAAAVVASREGRVR